MAEYFVLFLCYSRIWTLRQSCLIRDASHLLQLNMGMYFSVTAYGLLFVKYIPKFNGNKCYAFLITGDCLKVHILE